MKNITWTLLLLTISTFSQTPGNGVTDIDGNRYNSVIIGTQEWTVENLKVTKYSDGTPIQLFYLSQPWQWGALTSGASCYYNNTAANSTTYGILYNWYAVAGIHDTDPNTPNKTIAPTGWHVPTEAEWTTLTNYLGGESIAGGKMKSTGTTLWANPNTGATNESGFSAIPGGWRDISVDFSDIRNGAFWWSSSEYNLNTNSAILRYLYYNLNTLLNLNITKSDALSVRLIKNTPLSNSTFNSSSLKLYPNPVVSILNVKTDYNLINQPYTIIDGLGRVVLNGKLNEVESTINVEQLSKGIYYLKIAGNITTKFIKE
jgi:uncharacterized protein (TIGR02145 family)